MFSRSEHKTTQGEEKEEPEPTPSAQEVRLIIIYNSSSEFLVERHAIWNDVLPELQATATNHAIELEFSDYLVQEGGGESKLTSRCVENVRRAIQDTNTIIVCLIGDLYGDVDLPLQLKKEEFEQIRSTVFEQSQDVKFLNECYEIDRTTNPESYRLSSKSLSPDKSKKLITCIQKGAQSAFEDGSINQANPQRQQSFFQSPLHLLVRDLKKLKGSKRVHFVLRKFEKLIPPFAESDESRAKAVAELKNELTVDFPCLLFPLSDDGATFLTSKNVEKYKDDFTKQIMDKLRESILPFATPQVPTLTIQEISETEEKIHTAYSKRIVKRKWTANKKAESRIEKILNQPGPGMYLVQGPTECGKTRVLCKIWEEVAKKKPNVIRIIRFVNLTYSCMYAHEIWYHICISICVEAGVDPTPILPFLHLSELLETFSSIIEEIQRPIYVFIDDIHSVKMGRLLCPIERKSRKMPSNMIVVATALNVASIPQIFATASTVNLETPGESEIIDILKKELPADRKVTSEHAGVIKQQLISEGRSFTLASALIHEMMSEGEGEISGGLLGRLERIEKRLGAEPVSYFLKALLNSRNGLTRGELMDYLSSNETLLKSLGGIPCFPPSLMDEIMYALGELLTCDYVDGHRVYRISTITFLAVLRTRYVGDKVAVCQAIAEILTRETLVDSEPSISPRPLLLYTPFPRSLKRENGSADLRVMRQLWFYLLHTGNMDALKEATLCHFDFIDSTIRSCGIAHLLTMYEDTLLQVLHHDIQVLAEQVLLPSLPTIVRDGEQAAAEVIGRLRFTRAENSHFLNSMVEEAMSWVDGYGPRCLLVPLSCWVAPPEMSLVLTFDFKEWKKPRLVLVPTFNHQHILVTGNENAVGEIYMVHIASQFVLATYRGHAGVVTSICESSDGSFFTSTSLDKTLRIWYRNSTENTSRVLRPHAAKIICSVLSSDNTFLVTGSADSSAKVIDLESGDVIKTFPDHTGSVVSVQLTSNDLFLITGSGDFTVQLWSMKKGEIVTRMGGLMAPVTCVAITSNDAFVAVACEDETLRVFGTVSGQELHDMTGHEGRINALVAAHDDCQLFAATLSRIFCYDLHTGQIVLIWDTEVKAPVTSLQITRDNFFLISGCGAAVHVWNIRERIHDNVDAPRESEGGHVTSVALSPDDKMAVCGTFGGIVALWDLDIAQCVCTVVHSKRIEITTLSFSLDSSVVLSGNAAGNIILIEATHGRVLRSVVMHEAEIRHASWMMGKRVVTVDKSGLLRVWEAFEDEDENEVVKIDGVVAPLIVASTTSSNPIFISHVAGNPKELRIWCIENNGLTVKSRLAHNDIITAFSAASQGSLLVTASADESLKIWTIDSGYLTQVLAGHDASVTCCAMAEDERIVVSGSKDKKVILWNVSTGAVVHTLAARAPIAAVAITADGSVAFSADEEGWLQAWSCEKGTLLSSFNSHRPISALLSSTDATRLILKLPGCAQLPILCLHNTPAGHGVKNERKKSARNSSITSLTSNISDKKDSVVAMGDGGNSIQPPKSAAAPRTAPRPTFDKLERSKSRLSIGIEKDKSSTHTAVVPVAPPVTRSKACSML